MNRIATRNGFIGRIDFQFQIIERQIPPSPFGRNAAPQRILVREHFGLSNPQKWAAKASHQTSKKKFCHREKSSKKLGALKRTQCTKMWGIEYEVLGRKYGVLIRKTFEPMKF